MRLNQRSQTILKPENFATWDELPPFSIVDHNLLLVYLELGNYYEATIFPNATVENRLHPHKILQGPFLPLFPPFLVFDRSAARVACSKTSRTPSFVLAEHSRYLCAPILRFTSSPYSTISCQPEHLFITETGPGPHHGLPKYYECKHYPDSGPSRLQYFRH